MNDTDLIAFIPARRHASV